MRPKDWNYRPPRLDPPKPNLLSTRLMWAAGLTAAALVALYGYALVKAPPIDDAAKAYLQTLGLKGDMPVACVRMDTDGDLYVSCTTIVEGAPFSFECHLFGLGCRGQKPKVIVR